MANEGRLSTDTVINAYGALRSRALAAIDGISNKKTLLGGFFGNNDTLDQNVGAIKTLVYGRGTANAPDENAALERFKASGFDAVEDNDKIDSWLKLGKVIESSIAAIDGYADGATLESTVKLVAAATAKDVGNKAKDLAKDALDVVPWYVYGMVIAAVAGIVYLKVK